jgi:glycosyltransferase involved in cell wall biosynthesis
MSADVRWLHAHFIHTPSAVTRYASLMTGQSWSCSAHAKDIWTSPDWELRQNLGSADWAVTCTRIGHERLARLAPNPAHVRLVYHGLDLTSFAVSGQPLSRRDGTNPAEPVRLLSVGRAVEKKGLDLLLDALASCPPELNWTLTHIGGGELLKSLQARAERLGIADRVSWRGAEAQSAVLEAYRSADVFVLPCRTARNGDRDGLPNVLMEALSQRLVCLSTRVGGVPELIRNGETGLLVAPEDSAALAAALVRLIRDPDLRQRLAIAGERHVRATFDMRAGMARLVALFEASLAEEGGSAMREAAQ